MALHLIHGPLNSGRTGLILERVRATSRDKPMVVAPTGESRFALERELCPAGTAVLGPAVTTMRGLAEEAARVTATPVPRPATVRQRRALLAAAIEVADLRILRRSAATPGFANECERQFSRLRADGVEPARRAEGEPDPYLDELMGLYAGYLERLDRSGRDDGPGLTQAVTAALRTDPEAWGRRPVMLHGFDSLTLSEIELIEALAASADVTVSLTHEPDREALAARATLYERLRELGPASDVATRPVREYTHRDLLFHVERHFGEPDPPTQRDDGSVRFLRSAGRRGEAKAIATEIRRLIASGVPPSEIAVATLDTETTGMALRAAIEETGAAVALEGEVGIGATAVGTTVAALLDAAYGERSAGAVLRHLRAGDYAPDLVDELERRLARDRDAGREEARRMFTALAGAPIDWLERLDATRSDGARAAEILAEIAVEAAEAHDSDLELRAAGTIRGACRELADLGAAAPRPAALGRLLGELRVRAWQGPAGERIRIASPYTLRASRFAHLFVASLQDGELPRAGRVDPFLSEEQRRGLRLPEDPDPEHEDLYLFHVCLSRPTEGLWLSTRTADEEGKEAQPSPLLEMVAEMIEPAGPDAERGTVIERDLGAVVPSPSEATSETELARAMTAAGGSAALEELRLPPKIEARVATRVARAEERERASRGPRALQHPDVLAELASRTHFGATTLEAFAAYPFHWFIGHELRPEPLAPDDDPLVDGGIVHEALERLYRERPGGAPAPGRANLAQWKARAEELIAEGCEAAGFSPRAPADIARRRLIELSIGDFLSREAEESIALEPAMLEASFGDDDESAERPGLDLGEWRLHGKIDRVDLTSGGDAGLLRDYKFSSNATPHAKFESEGKLQLQLYAIALRELWGIEPLGGLYVPLRAREPRSRGILRRPALDSWLKGLDCVKTDCLSDEAFEEALAAAREAAGEAVVGMRSGAIDREPLDGARTDVIEWSAIDRRPRRAREAQDEGERAGRAGREAQQ